MTKKAKKVEEKTPLYFDLQGTDKMQKLQEMYKLWQACKRCPLSDFREGDDIVFAEGNPNSGCMIIGEGPGEEEEATGVPFVGASGKLLNQLLAGSSIDPDIRDLQTWYSKVPHNHANEKEFHEKMFEWRNKNFFITNVVACRPPENRTPTDIEVKGCWERLYNLIYLVDPLLIITLGKTPIQALVKRKIEITRYRGQIFDCTFPGQLSTVTYPVLAMFHPSYLLRKADWKLTDGDYAKTLEDFRKSMRILSSLKEATGAA